MFYCIFINKFYVKTDLGDLMLYSPYHLPYLCAFMSYIKNITMYCSVCVDKQIKETLFCYCYQLVNVIIWLLLSLCYCYHLVIDIIWLLLSFGYWHNSVIDIIWLLLSFGYCYHYVIVINWLTLSVYLGPKVITLNGP
jgi:hypothetical protein